MSHLLALLNCGPCFHSPWREGVCLSSKDSKGLPSIAPHPTPPPARDLSPPPGPPLPPRPRLRPTGSRFMLGFPPRPQVPAPPPLPRRRGAALPRRDHGDVGVNGRGDDPRGIYAGGNLARVGGTSPLADTRDPLPHAPQTRGTLGPGQSRARVPRRVRGRAARRAGEWGGAGGGRGRGRGEARRHRPALPEPRLALPGRLAARAALRGKPCRPSTGALVSGPQNVNWALLPGSLLFWRDFGILSRTSAPFGNFYYFFFFYKENHIFFSFRKLFDQHWAW